MRNLTARQSFTASIDTKAKLKAAAAQRGTSMSALVRKIAAEFVALGEFEEWLAERELQSGVTIQ